MVNNDKINMVNKYPLCKYLPKDITDAMEHLVRETNIRDKEYGFLICTGAKRPTDINDENTIAKEKICEGGACTVEVTGECPEDMSKKGFFHTHPSGITLPTRGDIEYAKLQNFKFLCIGGDKEIRCLPSKMSLDIIPSSEIEIDKMEEFKKKLVNCIIDIL